MKMEKAYCPNCGAPVFFKENRDDTFCQHCGTQVFKKDEQLELKLKYKDKQNKRDHEYRKIAEISDNLYIIIAGIITIICLVILYLSS